MRGALGGKDLQAAESCGSRVEAGGENVFRV